MPFQVRLAGGFMRKNGSFGRWRTLPTIEGQVYHVENEFPFHEKGAQSRTGEARASFEGYRLIDGIPEFRYRVGNLKVTEHLVKLPGKSGLLRKFMIKGSDEGVVWKLDPQAGVTYAFDKGTKQGKAWHLTGKEAESFAVRMEEVPAKFPILRLGMNDLAVCYNRKGDLHSGVIGQSWLMKGGKAIIPAQQATRVHARSRFVLLGQINRSFAFHFGPCFLGKGRRGLLPAGQRRLWLWGGSCFG